MNLSMRFLALSALIFAVGCTETTTENSNETKAMPTAPKANQVPEALVAHGDTRIDNYFWMRLSDEQKKDTLDPQTKEVLENLNAENAYRNEVMAHTDAFQDKLYEEIVGRIKQDDQSVPVKVDGYWYYTRYEEGKEYPVHCRKLETMDADEDVMLNVNAMAEGYSYYAIGGRSVSPNNNLVAYGVDTVSRRQYTVYIKDLTTGELLMDVIPETTGGATWANDNKTLFYSKQDPQTLRSSMIYKHVLGTDASEEDRKSVV